MAYTLSYRASRVEVWRWYWRMWHAKFWWLHLLMAAVVVVALANALGKPASIWFYASWFLSILSLVVIAFSAWPQVKFKPQERTLHVGPEGWSTQIGSISASRPWSGVASVQPASNTVVILSKTGNALIVPLRAFEDRTQMQQFVQDVQAWHRGHAV